MRFRILGPLEVFGESGLITLGGPKQRAVLAHLLVRANQVVPADSLIDQVWGDEPPDSARNTLQSYVSHLRKALGPERLEGRSPGYLLHIAADELDSFRFESLLREARRPNGQSERASDLLREALGLWRGPPFADLAAEQTLAGEIARLEELRLQAVEEKLAADLANGQHGEVVGELESLTREFPLRERLWAHLMLALYRSGRQADALATFQRAREVLANELGVDPSPVLQRVQERVLRQDSDLELKGTPLRGYRLLQQVGQGAFGVVYRAVQPSIGREIAIKAMHPELANHPDFVLRFEREAQIVAKLEHPHIVPLYDYWREPDAAYLIMRFLRGGSLAELLEQGPLEPERIASILDQVSAALAAAHREGVVHQDVKPANVLLDEAGNAYLSDFGVAIDVGARGQMTATMRHGTPAYLSPEQVRLEPATARSDVYSLGVVLYEALTGEPPFPDRSSTSLLSRHLNDPFPSVRIKRPELPDSIDDVIARATVKNPAARSADALDVSVAFRAAIEGVGAEAAPAVQVRNPYKGLRAFLEADADDFFGREDITRRLVDRLGEPGRASRFLAVVGPSGSGKSSVVRAGLVPALRQGALPGSERWHVIEVLPGSDPFRELELALVGVAIEPPSSLLETLEQDEYGLGRAIDRILPDPNAEVLLVLDQLEELFTITPGPVREQLLASLCAATEDPEGRIHIVTTLRADFYDQPLSVRGFGDLIAVRTEAIPPMSAVELERAIVAPAERAGLRLETGLVGAMVADVVERPGALPLLQHALTELAERREGGTLSLDVYRRIGGVSGALARRAGQLFMAMEGTEREACRQLFLRMVTLGEGTEDTRRRVRRSEVTHDGEGDATNSVIDAFGRHRLLSFDRDPATREPTVEIAHEALLTSWTLLHDWIDEARSDIRAERKLASAASEWAASGRDQSFLLRGARLEQTAGWAQMTTLALSNDDRAFLDASDDLRNQEMIARQADEQRARTLQRRSIRRLRAVVAAVVAAALIATTLTVVAVGQQRRASRESRVARARELAAASVASLGDDIDRSLLLAIDAVETTRSEDGRVLPEAQDALGTAVLTDRLLLTIPGEAVVRFSPDGSRLLTPGAEPSTANVYDATTGDVLLTIHGHGHGSDIFSHVNYSPDGRFISTSSRSDGSTEVWDAKTGAEVARLTVPSGDVCCWSEFSPDGSVIATDVSEGPVRLWNTVTGDQVNAIHSDGFALAFSPDGRRLWVSNCVVDWREPQGGSDERCLDIGDVNKLGADEPFISDVSLSLDGARVATSHSNGNVVVWDAKTLEPVATLVKPLEEIRDIELSPDGTQLAMGLGDGTARVWDLALTGGAETLVLAGHDAGIQSMKFSPDGSRLATASEDGTVNLWDVTPRGGGEWVAPDSRAVAYSPDGDTLAVGSTDGSVRLFDEGTGRLLRAFVSRIHPRPFSSVFPHTWLRWDPSGDRIASAVAADVVSVWDAETGDTLLTLDTPDVQDFEFSPDGSFLATIPFSGTATIWETSTGEPLRSFKGVHNAIAFSPDGKYVAAPYNPGFSTSADQIRVWDVESGAVTHTLDLPNWVWTLAFSPDGSRLIEGGFVEGLQQWDTSTWQALPSMSATLLGQLSGGLAFSPDGTQLATASQGGIHLWDLQTGRVTSKLTSIAASDVSFSPDGTHLAATTADRRSTVYALSIDEIIELARSLVTRDLTEQECRQYLHLDRCSTE